MVDNYWLFHRRKQLKLHQEELAERLRNAGFNVSRATVSSWETGRHSAPLNDPAFTKALAQTLELTVAELLILAGYEIENSQSAKQRESINKHLTLSREEKEKIMYVLLMLVSQDTPIETNLRTMNEIRNLVHSSKPLPPLTLKIEIVPDEES